MDINIIINQKLTWIFFAFSATFLLPACNVKTYTLLDHYTTVPKDSTRYANRLKFDTGLLNIIDTTVVYEEYNEDEHILTRLRSCIDCRVYRIYRFYPGGYFNAFHLNKDEALSAAQFNPLYGGKRGVYYMENGKIRYNLFQEIDQRRHIGKVRGTMTFKGDTLYVKQDNRKGIDKTTYPVDVFIKRKLPPEYFIYKAGW